MSEEIKELTDKEAMKILGEFATTCYDKGVKDALIADDGRPCITLDYHVAPRYDFSKLM